MCVNSACPDAIHLVSDGAELKLPAVRPQRGRRDISQTVAHAHTFGATPARFFRACGDAVARGGGVYYPLRSWTMPRCRMRTRGPTEDRRS